MFLKKHMVDMRGLEKEIAVRFGRKKGLLRHVKAAILNRLGYFKKYKRIDYSHVQRLVFVCKGNICRSPFGEFKAKQFKLQVASAGIAVNKADPACERGCETALAYGVDLSDHRSKSIYQTELLPSDLLVVFEPWQAEWLSDVVRRSGCQITLLGLHLRAQFPHIEDPYGLSPEYFTTCYSRIGQGVSSLVQKLSVAKSKKAVLVTESETTGAVAVIRSLGRAGYEVVAASRFTDAIGFKSKFVNKSLVSPRYHSKEFLPWLRMIIRENGIEAIIPSEGFLLAIRDDFEEFVQLIPFSSDKNVVYRGLSKCDLFTVVDKANTPRSCIVDLRNYDRNELVRTVQSLHFPLFVKVDALYSCGDGAGKVYKAVSKEKLIEVVAGLVPHYEKCLIQEYVPGQGVGVFFVMWDGRVIADFMHMRLHEVPHTGGVSSLRRSYFHRGIYDDAVKKCAQMNWTGPVMMEYRYDKDIEKFYLIEMNGRFWGSLHLPLYAGVDFPKILLEMYLKNESKIPVSDWRNKKTLSRQTFPLEVQHVWSVLKDYSISTSVKVKAVINFVVDTIDPRIHSDYFSYKGDRILYFYTAKKLINNIVMKDRK